VNGELLEAAREDVAMRSLSTEADLDGAGVRLEAAANTGVDTTGAAPGGVVLPANAHVLVTVVAKELLNVLLDLVDLLERDSHLSTVCAKVVTTLGSAVCAKYRRVCVVRIK